MVVRLDAGREAVRRYVAEQAAGGLEHVRSLVKQDRDALLSHIADFSEEEGQASPGAGQYSALQVLQHLNGGFARSLDRLQTLSSGRSWTPSGPVAGGGSIPEGATTSFVEARRQFAVGSDAILALLSKLDGSKALDLTADHANLGPFNWLQWAVYSHHVHTYDHVGQMAEIRAAVKKQ
jgi:hypothetical protein